jgi:hypothetical protein
MKYFTKMFLFLGFVAGFAMLLLPSACATPPDENVQTVITVTADYVTAVITQTIKCMYADEAITDVTTRSNVFDCILSALIDNSGILAKLFNNNKQHIDAVIKQLYLNKSKLIGDEKLWLQLDLMP